jgi:uncharacterized protein (TIGR03435 family)
MQCSEIRNYFADYLAEDLERSTKEEFGRHLKECPVCHAELEALTDLWMKLGSVPAGDPASPDLDIRLRGAAESYQREVQAQGSRRRLWKRLPAIAALAAAVAVAVLLPTGILHSAPAVLEDSTGSRKIQYGELVRPSGDMSAMLSMADGPRVEMRSESEFSLERADDGGTKIRLNKGGVIVDAAGPQSGNLYVQTKDMLASVSGAVSLVRAEEQGSRVAAIGGEVRVQQGTAEQKLRSGEQVTTNAKMESISVEAQLVWSRAVAAHVAMLQQAGVSTLKERVAFEVVSIRPSGPAAPAAAGARGAGGGNSGSIKGCVPASSGYSQQLDPRRLAITKATLFQLIGYAYPVSGVPDTIWKQYPGPDSCLLLGRLGLLPGGPDWIRTDMWDIEASIPGGSFGTRLSLTDPKLQQMLQTLLEERFKVVLRRETREVPVYLLKVGRNGAKFNGPREIPSPTPLQPGQKPRAVISRGPDGTTTRTVQSPDGTFAGGPPASVLTGMQVASAPRPQEGTIASGPPSRDGISKLDAAKISMTNWVNHLYANLDGRPVLDRTGLTGKYDFHFDFQGPGGADVAANPSQFDGLGESVNREAVKAMGFELEESRAPIEVWVIERAEKPSEN